MSSLIILQYEHGDELVISGDIITHKTPIDNCEDIVLTLFWHIYLGEHIFR